MGAVMVAIPKRNTVQDAIYRVYEDRAEGPRAHLGASVLGEECSRKLWYGFRWASAIQFPGRMLRLFRRGHKEEEWIVDDLKAAGMTVREVDPDTGEQYRFAAGDGHLGGSCDGLILGVPGAPKTWHVLEVKTANASSWKTLERDGVERAQPKHYTQMQVYMRKFKLTRALYVSVCKDDDRIYTERVRIDKVHADAAIRRGEDIIRMPNPPERISEDPAFFRCKFCDHAAHCQRGDYWTIERNCRTCVSSTPIADGKWRCEHHGRELRDMEPCGAHLVIPSMVGLPVQDVDEDARKITYTRPNGSQIEDAEGSWHD